MAEKEGGIVKKGDEGFKMALSLYEEFGLPLGLLPLDNVIEVGFVRSTGYLWILQEKRVEHKYKMISQLVGFDKEITCYLEKKRIKKLKGVKARAFMIWTPCGEVIVDEPPTRNIRFKSIGGIPSVFPIEAFAAVQ